MLTQVDGNYFELLYVLWGILGFAALDQLKAGPIKKLLMGWQSWLSAMAV